MSRQRRWTPESIIEEISTLHERGESLCTRNMRRLGYSGMVTTAYRPELFGSWRNALRAAGLEPDVVCQRTRKWTKQRIIEQIRKLHEAGEDLCHSGAKRNHQYLVVVASSREMFGSWRKAVEAATLSYSGISKHRSWTKEQIVEEIRRLAALGDPLSHDEAKRSHGALVSAASSRRYFGSWAAAVQAAGVDYEHVRKINRWTREKIIAIIIELHSAGQRVNNSNMRRLGYRGMMEAAGRPANFGSWAAAVAAAGLDYDEVRKV
jgi:hypothetical protein